MRKAVLVIAAIVLSSCQTAPKDAPPFSPAPEAPTGYGTLYLYRWDAPPFTGLIRFNLSGRQVFQAPEQAYTWIHVKAGEYTLLAEWPPQPGWKSPQATVVIAPGAPTFVRAHAKVDVKTPGLTTPGGIGRVSFLTLVAPSDAQAQLFACCRYLEAAIANVN